MKKRERSFYLYLAGCLLFLVFIVGRKELALRSGQQIRMRVSCSAEKHSFFGAYLRLSYPDMTPQSKEVLKIASDESVAFVLKKHSKENYWICDRKHTPTKKLEPGEVLLRSKGTGYGYYFGIENYFVENGEALNRGSVSRFATIRVASDGSAIVESLD